MLTENHTFIPAFSAQQMRKINTLIGSALVSGSIRERLVSADDTLAQEFDLESDVWATVKSIDAPDLETLCAGIQALQVRDCSPVVARE